MVSDNVKFAMCMTCIMSIMLGGTIHYMSSYYKENYKIELEIINDFYEKQSDDMSSYYKENYKIELEIIKDFYEKQSDDKIRSYKAYNGILSNHTNGINGVYFPDEDYYCVNVWERTIGEIQKTEYHEHCHYLIDNDKDNHFCKNGN